MSAFVSDEQLALWLTELRLPGVRDRLSNLLDEAGRQQLSLRDFVVQLCRHELQSKRAARQVRRLQQARFPMVRELADYDCQAQPSVTPEQLQELGTARWLAHGENVILVGPPGVGKSHLAIGLGRAAIQHDYSVLYVSAASLMASLTRAYDTEQWDTCLRSFIKPQLLIIDEFGYLPVPASAAHLLF